MLLGVPRPELCEPARKLTSPGRRAMCGGKVSGVGFLGRFPRSAKTTIAGILSGSAAHGFDDDAGAIHLQRATLAAARRRHSRHRKNRPRNFWRREAGKRDAILSMRALFFRNPKRFLKVGFGGKRLTAAREGERVGEELARTQPRDGETGRWPGSAVRVLPLSNRCGVVLIC